MKTIFLLLFLIPGIRAYAQQLPANTCGIVNVYDAAGNRTKRVYFCNNGSAPHPRITGELNKEDVINPEEIQEVDALFPNPNTGRFSVTFSKPLQKAEVTISDVGGKTIQKFKASGNRIDFDLSFVTSGVYFVQVNDNGNIITQKVLKQ